MTDLTGKVCLVTGGSRGLGREMVLAFAEHGSDVVIASRKIDACESLAAEVREKYGVRAFAIAANVGVWPQCDELVERVYAELGRVDVLVNNAGLSPLYLSLDEVSEELWDKVLGINLKGPFRLTAAVGRRMAEGEGGSVINISSIASIRADALSLPYSAAKAGLNALTEGFAQAYAPKVRVNTILCGPFLTDISKAWPPEIHELVEQGLALGRAGQPDEIVGAALYFASEASSFTTGATLRVDGGTR
jgi:NAD(P)-dependent dehydrogenase (short-subunit alcohol dehydrogenase family)